MNLIKNVLLLIILSNGSLAFARGGDDVGNGGFAYKQSVNILKMAATALEEKIKDSTLKDIVDFPERRLILQDTLGYEDLDKLSKKNQYRGGRKLAMNYIVNPATVIVLKPYFEAFAGKTDTELEDASLEVQKRLLHEASHIWGYKEEDSEKFAIAFLENVAKESRRPTEQISILPGFCSCLNGKSDIVASCDNFCQTKPNTTSPILYLNTVMEEEISSNPKLGNLYNWCNVQLPGDMTAPQCFLSATDGAETIENIPVTISKNSNSLTANINMLSFDKTYILKIVEGKTGSNAQSKEFQLRRKTQQEIPPEIGALKIAPVNQYTCLLYGGVVSPDGRMTRTSYARNYFYFPSFETPAPIPPAGPQDLRQFVCHDEQLHPGNDSAEYPRLELLPQSFMMWDKTDFRFARQSEGGMVINSIISKRLLDEYGIRLNLDLFKLINFPNRPSLSSNSSISYPLNIFLMPFTNQVGETFCPTTSDFNSGDPLFSIMGNYIDSTEGLYLAEKEAETVGDRVNGYKTIYGTMFITESVLKNIGFYIENGIKVKANQEAMNSRVIYYYWPASDLMDPLAQGSRKLFTVKTPDTLNGTTPTGIPPQRTLDKRIGCVPETKSKKTPPMNSCNSDFECANFCCDKNTNSCSTESACNKPAGESCITSSFCQSYPAVVCKVVKSGYNSDGSQACTLRCPSVMLQGSCTNGICNAPFQPPVPPFDPRDCSNAVDP